MWWGDEEWSERGEERAKSADGTVSYLGKTQVADAPNEIEHFGRWLQGGNRERGVHRPSLPLTFGQP